MSAPTLTLSAPSISESDPILAMIDRHARRMRIERANRRAELNARSNAIARATREKKRTMALTMLARMFPGEDVESVVIGKSYPFAFAGWVIHFNGDSLVVSRVGGPITNTGFNRKVKLSSYTIRSAEHFAAAIRTEQREG